MAKKFETTVQDDAKAINNINRITESIYLRKTTAYEIGKLIKKLKGNKAPGIDGISNHIIKISEEVIIPILVKLFNTCMSAGKFPNALKIASIVPLHKGDDKSDPSNYRPISLLPQFGKLFEKVIENRLVKFLDKKKVISPHQFGFRKYYSTELAVTEIQNMLLEKLDEGKVTCTIFLDLAKAFDTVNHNILVKKLERYGIRGQALLLLKSYLENRQHLVKINDTKSTLLTLKIGVPQGSVLGPLLFLLFINDLPCATNFIVKLFADDTLLSLDSANYLDLQRRVNEELRKVSRWLRNNKLTLNISKTKFMIISNKKKPPNLDFQIQIDNTAIEKCSYYKYLGVYLDEELSWKVHIDNVSDKIAKMCGLFSKLRYTASFDILRTVYHALVAAHLKYCNLVWGNAAESILSPLKKMQDRIVRIISFAPFNCENVNILYEDLQLLNLEQIHKIAKAKFVYKHENKRLPNNFDNYLTETRNIHDRSLRSTSLSNYVQVWGKTNHSFKMLRYDAIKVWNDIPIEIRKLSHLRVLYSITNAFY